MRRVRLGALALVLSAALPSLNGCGGNEKVGIIQDTPEAKKADFDGQKAVQDYMSSKTQKKAK